MRIINPRHWRNASRAFGMRWSVRSWTLLLLIVAGCASSANVTPLLHAHAHNDYLHPHPLRDALACGFCSVEADIHLVNGELLVAHDRDKTRPGRTLEKLYLAPLRRRVRDNGG